MSDEAISCDTQSTKPSYQTYPNTTHITCYGNDLHVGGAHITRITY